MPRVKVLIINEIIVYLNVLCTNMVRCLLDCGASADYKLSPVTDKINLKISSVSLLV